jgi:hypothetical protein
VLKIKTDRQEMRGLFATPKCKRRKILQIPWSDSPLVFALADNQASLACAWDQRRQAYPAPSFRATAWAHHGGLSSLRQGAGSEGVSRICEQREGQECSFGSTSTEVA